MLHDPIIACPECGLLQRTAQPPEGGCVVCSRCGATLQLSRPDSLDRTLALTIAGIVLFIIANSFPFLSFQMQGQLTESTLATGVLDLYAQGRVSLAVVVAFTSIIAPAIQLALLTWVLLPLRFGVMAPGTVALFRWIEHLRPWGMMDVFMLGILVSTVKLADMATIIPGISLFAFVVLIFILAAAQAALDPDVVWSRIQLPESARRPPHAGEAMIGCQVCELPVPEHAAPRNRWGEAHCPRCNARLHPRKPMSLQRTWALLITAMLLYLPANLYPIMTVTSFGRTRSDTIMSGAVFLLTHGMWPLAVIVFVASVFVPLLKILTLIFLLLSVQLRSQWKPRDRTRLYRITEAIGRWSMVDIYVVTILVALVRLDNLASVEAEAGAVFFCAVVIITMFAAMSFDPRLIWDRLEAKYDHGQSRAAGSTA